jgi:hypothetical protein
MKTKLSLLLIFNALSVTTASAANLECWDGTFFNRGVQVKKNDQLFEVTLRSGDGDPLQDLAKAVIPANVVDGPDSNIVATIDFENCHTNPENELEMTCSDRRAGISLSASRWIERHIQEYFNISKRTEIHEVTFKTRVLGGHLIAELMSHEATTQMDLRSPRNCKVANLQN